MSHHATRFLVFVALVSLFGLAFSVPARAQVSGATLNGLITDAQGGAVVGAKVSAKNSGTGIATETETNEAGAYTIPNLAAGDYEVTVTVTGFKTAVSKVNLIVGAKQQMNFAMTVGEVAQVLRISNMTVYRLISSGQLAAVRVGKSYRLREEDVDQYLAERFTEAG